LPGPSDKRHGSVHRCDLAERRLRFDRKTPSLRQWQHGLLTTQPWTGDDSVDGTFVQAQGQFLRLVPASARQRPETIWSWPGQPATSVRFTHEVDPAHPVQEYGHRVKTGLRQPLTHSYVTPPTVPGLWFAEFELVVRHANVLCAYESTFSPT